MLTWAFIFLGIGVTFFVVMTFAEKIIERNARKKARLHETANSPESGDGNDDDV